MYKKLHKYLKSHILSLIYGGVLLGIALVLGLAFFSYHEFDPSWNVALDADTQNLLGAFGAGVADFFFQGIGYTMYLFPLFFSIWGLRLCMLGKIPYLGLRILSFFPATLSTAFFLTVLWPYAGGASGEIFYALLPKRYTAIMVVLSGFFSFICWFWITTLRGHTLYRSLLKSLQLLKVMGLFIHARALWLREKLIGREPYVKFSDQSSHKSTETIQGKAQETEKISFQSLKERHLKKEAPPQEKVLSLSEDHHPVLPSLELLQMKPATSAIKTHDAAHLQEKAEKLQTVLKDFGIKGKILHVHPGPIVSLFELEPAAGIKSARVITLAEDIARSMQAVAARVAIIRGKNIIGIELPNSSRETVFLKDVLDAADFEKTEAKLLLALGKDIAGKPVLADLAKMPHLLVAGTTGSGKSVGVNAMILSLLYRLSPQECRFLMIDPKMLELSVYNGIPHLLTPVITDPKKAVQALKWVVAEMEKRYKAMSHLGVRNIHSYNMRVTEAQKKEEKLTRQVRTGFDEKGQVKMEEQVLDLNTFPFIVVIVDEMADLMLIAGKDIETAVQRLAQMARAAGIHLIMATQRPSVDVVTGTIKANFPSRISFHVTSKIDSRTILGEQGAEQLLGHGDMLYMSAGGRITRVHGPFVSDQDVENVVSFLRDKYKDLPQEDFLSSSVLETVDDEELTGKDGEKDDLYTQAVEVVLRDNRPAASYLQRRFTIGYNTAAKLIERMEADGIVSPPNQAGKRTLMDRNRTA